VKSRMPTRLNNGEGRVDGEAIDTCTHSIRLLGTARWEGGAGNRWRPVWHEGSGLHVADRRRCRRVSDRAIVLLRPGNAGGGKGPDFWYAPEGGKGMVIGESLQTPEVSLSNGGAHCNSSRDELQGSHLLCCSTIRMAQAVPGATRRRRDHTSLA
jgi:hypothetical protein